MSESQNKSAELPKAKVKRLKWHFSVVWIVPLVAAVMAGYLVYQRVQEFGPKITIRFRNGGGLKIGETPIKYRGVTIGEVRGVELSKDNQRVEVSARLKRSAMSIAREGALFWIVRPEVGVGTISGLATIVTGPHIEALPGSGASKSEFVGLENAPVSVEQKGLKVFLLASRLASLKAGSPVYYRGIEVGAVQKADLSTNATAVVIHVLIRQRYANLVRTGSKFWNASGVDVKLGLFRGAEISVESLRSLVSGGIAFATPNDPKSVPVRDGIIFHLEEEAKKEWLEWTPILPIPPEQ